VRLLRDDIRKGKAMIHWIGPAPAFFDLVSIYGLPYEMRERIGDDIRAVWRFER